MLALVRGHAPDEEPLGARSLATAAEAVEGPRVGREMVVVQVDQERANQRLLVAAADELGFVVPRIGERKVNVRRQHGQFLASLYQRTRDGWLPTGEVLGRRDVVVVADQGLARLGPGL